MINGDWLMEANELLSTFENSIVLDCPVSQNVFIVGAPRSGTTLLNQFIACCCDIGYVDNLMASFWKSPTFGALLSKKLLSQRFITSSSNYGQTLSISDPHEFGGFWRDALGYKSMEQIEGFEIKNWQRLMLQLDQIANVFQKPMMYKIFQLYWHIVEFHNLKSNSKWLWIERESKANARSLLKFRMERTGSFDNWVSAKPLFSKSFEKGSNEEQVMSQVIGINRWILSQLEKIDKDAWLKISYEDLVNEPLATIQKISEYLNVDMDLSKAGDFMQGIKPLPISTSSKKLEHAFKVVVNKAP